MQETILIVYLVVSIALIGIILLQHGKGADMGASFGAGAANTVFGAAGSGNVLTKTTTILAILFFGIALSISYLNSDEAVIVDEVLDETAISAENAPALEAALPASTDTLEAQIAPQDPVKVEEVPTLAAEQVEETTQDAVVEEKTETADK